MILTVTNNASKPLTSPVFIENPIELSSSQTLPVSSGSSTKPVIDVNPPAVVVLSNESSPQFASHHRLGGFSGKSPRPSHEADYNTWRASVKSLLKTLPCLTCTAHMTYWTVSFLLLLRWLTSQFPRVFLRFLLENDMPNMNWVFLCNNKLCENNLDLKMKLISSEV